VYNADGPIEVDTVDRSSTRRWRNFMPSAGGWAAWQPGLHRPLSGWERGE
jgi:hypothetical protein